jgi:MerR family transcriptional regulator, light-induced transcriptional regulator
MAIYSIRDLEKLTGIKKHTIRIWEQRYGIIKPRRTDTNIRYYTDDELRHLFNVALLNRNGIKISKLATMPAEQVSAVVAGIMEQNNTPSSHTETLTLAMLNFDEATFERIFAMHQNDYGFEQTMTRLIYPFLERLNALWLNRSISPAHEKFITHLIRRKLSCAIDDLPFASNRDAPVFFLYLPEGESQELTLMFMNYILRNRHHRVVYLGMGVSLTDLRDACGTLEPSYVFTILDSPLVRQTVQHYVNNAALAISAGQLLVTGSQVFHSNTLQLPDNVRLLGGMTEALSFLDSIKRK